MISIRLATVRSWGRGAILTVAAVAMVACAGDVDDTTGSRLTQPPAGTPPPKPIPANDITIVGQEVGHAILDLPEIADAPTPPLVQFTGVTSIIMSPTPIDTQPYTDLLRDRLLLITRLKLRFLERTLPPLVVSGKKKKSSLPPVAAQNTTDPDYEILAELRGRYDADLYRIQVEFVNAHTHDVLYNGLFSIRKEGASGQATGQPEVNPTDDRIPPPEPGAGTDQTAQPIAPPAAPPAGVQ